VSRSGCDVVVGSRFGGEESEEVVRYEVRIRTSEARMLSAALAVLQVIR
jgi:hypothetical protein